MKKNLFVIPKKATQFTMNPSPSDVKAFAQLEGSAYEMGVGYLVCMANRLSKLKENAFALPISAI